MHDERFVEDRVFVLSRRWRFLNNQLIRFILQEEKIARR